MRKPFHAKMPNTSWFWFSTMVNRFRLYAMTTTEMAAAPIASSYEIICAE